MELHRIPNDIAKDHWTKFARSREIRCTVCGHYISYADREIYYATKRCSEHQHVPEPVS